MKSKRLFNYDRNRLPNEYVASLDFQIESIDDLLSGKNRGITGQSVGYPAWNLLYYCLFCSITRKDQIKIVETGTNLGLSTIIMAQALHDMEAKGIIHTYELNAETIVIAERNFKKSGVGDYIKQYHNDSISGLEEFVKIHTHIDFAFLDACHKSSSVLKEFSIVEPLVRACNGRVYFDNTESGGVADALIAIRNNYRGALVEFNNCSICPPGQAIWQPL